MCAKLLILSDIFDKPSYYFDFFCSLFGAFRNFAAH